MTYPAGNRCPRPPCERHQEQSRRAQLLLCNLWLDDVSMIITWVNRSGTRNSKRRVERGKQEARMPRPHPTKNKSYLTHVLSPSCFPHHSARKQSCLGGKDHQGVLIALNPLFRAPGQPGQRGERICWHRSHCSRPKCVQAGGRCSPCRDRPAQCRARQRQLPRTWHLKEKRR